MNVKPSDQKLNVSKPVALRLTESERNEAQKLALRDERSVASFARLMYLRGLARYLADKPKAS